MPARLVTAFDSFDDGMHHVPMAEPFDDQLRKTLFDTAQTSSI